MSTEAPVPEQPVSPEASDTRGPLTGDAETPESPAWVVSEGIATPTPFPHTLSLLLDVRINVSVEVGRVQMPVRQVMELGPGAVIELERSASEPVEIHANGRYIGRGEIVVVGEQFGVRITELGPTV